MKVLIISDSHGHIVNLRAIAEIATKSKFDAIIHAGDWNTIETVETIISTKIPLYSVLGNADIDPMVGKRLKAKSKRFAEDYLVIELDGEKVGITHKPSDNEKYFGGKKPDLIINGHYHSSYESVDMPVKIIRPGAVVLGINFAVYDTKKGEVEFVKENEQI